MTNRHYQICISPDPQISFPYTPTSWEQTQTEKYTNISNRQKNERK